MIPAPKFLEGSVEGDLYISRNGTFSVQLPHPPSKSKSDSYEWTYTKVREIYQPNESADRAVVGAVFGPAAFDLNLYHTVLVQSEMQQPKKEYVKGVFDKKVNERGSNIDELHYEEFVLNGNMVYYAVYDVNAQYLVLSLTDIGSSFYAIEADVNFDSADAPTLDVLESRQWETFNSMLNTFTILKPVK